jgi:hypothetical protein
MKNTFALALTLLSFNALSAVEFIVKSHNLNCTISNDKVVRTLTFNKGQAGYTTTSQIKSFGITELAEKAISLSTTRTSPLNILYTATVDGQTGQMNVEDSAEARVIVQFMTANCK